MVPATVIEKFRYMGHKNNLFPIVIQTNVMLDVPDCERYAKALYGKRSTWSHM
jgi:hypothetical protein